MQFTIWDYIAFPLFAALCIGVFYGALRLVGFFGLGVLRLAIIFIVVHMDLEKDGPGGIHPSVLAEQFKARDRMSRSEKSSLVEEQRSRLQPQSLRWFRAPPSSYWASGFTFSSKDPQAPNL